MAILWFTGQNRHFDPSGCILFILRHYFKDSPDMAFASREGRDVTLFYRVVLEDRTDKRQ